MPGCLFFALKGDKFDGNAFAAAAIAAGAAYAVIDNPEYLDGSRFLLVPDVLEALQQLARHHRRQLNIPVLGLTGSNGKTTTKELISSVLSQRFNTQYTRGNLNNHIGVPLTILTVTREHEIAVIEMGANHQKEIAMLCSIAQPTHGLITNVGKAHLEGFGGVEGVKKGKGELYDFLNDTGGQQVNSAFGRGVAFINSDNVVLQEMQRARGMKNIIYYGAYGPENLVSGELVENSPFLTIRWTNNRSGESHTVKTQLTGAYNFDNVLAAACIGVYFGLSDIEVSTGIADYQPKNNRSQVVQTETNQLICDYYNANPSSMLVAIENIGKLTADRKVLVLGDMFEMGDEAAAEHLAVINKAMETPVDERIFIGEEFAKAGKQVKGGAIFYPAIDDAIAGLKARPVRHSTVLLKGSRGMALERLLDLF